jgi:hypothetical protein
MPGRIGWPERLGVVLIALCAALAAILEALLVPLYIGSIPFPLSVVMAILSNLALPRLARALIPSTGVAAVPFIMWLVVMVGFGLVTRPEGDVILPGGELQWVTYGLLFGGALAGVVGIVTSTPVPQRPLTASTPTQAGPPSKGSAARR